MLHNFAFKNRLHHPGRSVRYKQFSHHVDARYSGSIPWRIPAILLYFPVWDSVLWWKWFFRQLSAQFNGLSQEIRSFFLAVLFPNPQFKIDEVSFCADICHNWCISVKTLVGTGYAFLIGFRIVQKGLHQYRQEQSRYPGLSALCAFHAACLYHFIIHTICLFSTNIMY